MANDEKPQEEMKILDKKRVLDFFGGKLVDLPKGYRLTPLNALGIANLEEEFDISFQELHTFMISIQDKPRLGKIIKVLWCWLRQDHPDLRYRELAMSFGMDEILNLSDRFGKILALMKPNVSMEDVPADFQPGQEETEKDKTNSTGPESSTPSPKNTDGQQTQ